MRQQNKEFKALKITKCHFLHTHYPVPTLWGILWAILKTSHWGTDAIHGKQDDPILSNHVHPFSVSILQDNNVITLYIHNTSHASIPYGKQLPLQRMVGTIGSVW